LRLIKIGTLIFSPDFATVGRSKERAFEQKEKVHKHFPDEVIDRLARAFYPAILACWNSEEGQREFAAWQAEQAHHANNEKQEVPTGELPVVHIAIVCGFWQGASGRAHPVFISSRLGVHQTASP